MSTAKDRRDAADRAKYDGLTLTDVNILVRAHRYRNGSLHKGFLKRKAQFIENGYWNSRTGEPTERGLRVIQIACGVPSEDGHARSS